MKQLILMVLCLNFLITPSLTIAEDDAIAQERLQQLLAPVALYPDTVLTHLLIASTYPLEVVQADRWRKAHPDLAGREAVEAAGDKPWDPSVKALLAFPDLLSRMSEDLLWTQELGEAFLASEADTLDAVQALRQQALASGALDDMEYQEVVQEDQEIIIQPLKREVIYVPYYDPRYVYGSWAWSSHPPVYWPHPPRYRGGFYWGFYAPVGDWFYFSGFHWGHRTVVISYNRPYYYSRHRHYGYRPQYTERWHHNPQHRRGARYHLESTRKYYSDSSRNRRYRTETARPLKHHRSRVEAIYGRDSERGTRLERKTPANPQVLRERSPDIRTSSRARRPERSTVQPAASHSRVTPRVRHSEPDSRRATLQRSTNNRPVSRAPSRHSSRSGGDRGGRLR